MFEKIPAESKEEEKKFTEDELFKIALKHIESMVNHGSSLDKANVKNLAGQEGSFVEESIRKAHEMVANGEAEKIARREDYKGGVEAPKDHSEED